MARLSKKITADLDDLPDGYSSKEELIALLLNDPAVVAKWISASPGQHPTMDVNSVINAAFIRNSWQLTWWGCAALIASHRRFLLKNANNSVINGRILINLNNIINGPWKLQGQYLVVWDQTIHFELQIFDGDMQQFVDFHVPRWVPDT